MSGALRQLLEHLIDYAGLFPPAGLDMGTTVRNYAQFLESPDHWMLERLIVPVARFEEFEREAETLLPQGEEDEPWALSALVRPANDDGLEADLDRIAVFNERHAQPEEGLAIVDVIELKAASPDEIEDALDEMPDEVFPFFELPVADDPRGLIATLVGGEAGAKIRTGGITADLYPSVSDVARFIVQCARADVPFKATAGLHHPLRHDAPETGAAEHGFLNVFVAAVLAAHDQSIDQAEIEAVLESREIDRFVLTGDAVGWGEHRVDAASVEDARLGFAVSFGSCSFDEPRDDLRLLGLFPQADHDHDN